MWRVTSCGVPLVCCWSSDNITWGPAAHSYQSLRFERVRGIATPPPPRLYRCTRQLWVMSAFPFVSLSNQEADFWDQLPVWRSERCWSVSVSGIWLGSGCCVCQCGQTVPTAEDGRQTFRRQWEHQCILTQITPPKRLAILRENVTVIYMAYTTVHHVLSWTFICEWNQMFLRGFRFKEDNT